MVSHRGVIQGSIMPISGVIQGSMMSGRGAEAGAYKVPPMGVYNIEHSLFLGGGV